MHRRLITTLVTTTCFLLFIVAPAMGQLTGSGDIDAVPPGEKQHAITGSGDIDIVPPPNLTVDGPGGFEADAAPLLADFSAEGLRLAPAAKRLTRPEFFGADMTGAVASRDYYTVFLDVPREIRRPVLDFSAGFIARAETWTLDDPRLRFELIGGSEQANDVTVALFGDSGHLRNYLVRVEADEPLALRSGSLEGVKSIAMLSFQPFSVRVDALHKGASVFRQSYQAMAPQGAARAESKAVSYCQEAYETIRITADSTGGYVYGRAKREEVTSNVYSLDIEYPAGTLFHEWTSTTYSPGNPACNASSYNTQRVSDTSITHVWEGMDDTVLFCNGLASAECLTGCSETFTIRLGGSSIGICLP